MSTRKRRKAESEIHQGPFMYGDFKNAMDTLEASLNSPGYALLIGASGSGKTTLLRSLGSRLDRSRYQLLYICQGHLTSSSVARLLAEAMHLHIPRTRAAICRMLMQHLRTLATHLLLWVDEAQLLPEETLEELRLLSESDLDGPPLFSIVLAGLPSLRKNLLAPRLFPLLRRIQVKAELKGLRIEELEPFLRHLGLVSRSSPFSSEALSSIFEHGRGIPALIATLAQLCQREHPKETITVEMVAQTVEGMDWHY
jgi:general secretion pathway protein A